MTIASEITRIKNAVAGAYISCSNKGAALPSSQTVANLASTIDGLVTEKYGIPLSALIGETNANGLLARPTGGNLNLSLNGVKDIANSVFLYKFQRSDALKTFIFSDLISLSQSSSLQYAFQSCTNLESVTFPKLAIIGSVSATSTNYRQFYYAFNGCTKLTSLTFPELTAIYCNGTAASYGTFYGNNTIQKLYFPKLTTIARSSGYSNATAANNVFNTMAALTEIHFASANKSAIQASTGYSTAWGSSATIYFDL